MIYRYLLNVSYIGTFLRGSQKQWILSPGEEDSLSVEGNIEKVLKKLRRTSISDLTISSRTDAGVHALNNTAHFDLETKSGAPFGNLQNVIGILNKNLLKNDSSIVITNLRIVPKTFHARFSALSRTYLYRIALPKNQHHLTLPIQEWKRLHLITHPSFDIEKFKEAAGIFEGVHDFETFRKVDKSQRFNNIRTIYSIKVTEGAPFTGMFYNQIQNDFDFYDITVKGRAFVHNQIRRMIGALEAVAIGKITEKDVCTMLQVPSKHSWISSLTVAPAWGLYLYDIQYDPKDLLLDLE